MKTSVLVLLYSVSGVDNVLWPYLLEFLLQEEFTLAVPAICKALLVIAKKKMVAEVPKKFHFVLISIKLPEMSAS